MSHFVKNLLREELRFKTMLSDDAIEHITDSFIERLGLKRHTIVPTFLNDTMYNAVKSHDPNLDYQRANEIYKSALQEYNTIVSIQTSNSSDEEWIDR